MVGVKMGVFTTTFYPQNPSKNLNPPPLVSIMFIVATNEKWLKGAFLQRKFYVEMM
jgi:hypothetical protein